MGQAWLSQWIKMMLDTESSLKRTVGYLCGHEHVLMCGGSFLVLNRWIQFPTPPAVTKGSGSGVRQA